MKAVLHTEYKHKLYVLVVVLIGCNLNYADGAERNVVKWVLPIASTEADDEISSRLLKLKDVLQNKFEVQQHNNRNPTCVFWVEVTNWNPNPGESGYVIVVQQGGAILLASDVRQLDLAIERIKNEIEIKSDGVYLPVGLLTNYPLVTPKSPRD